jgi:hypothetical protein
MKLLKDMRLWVVASYAVFAVGLMAGWTWWDKQSPQYQDYMLGRAAFSTTMYDRAVMYFDRSYADYNASRNGEAGTVQSHLVAAPSLEIAELSEHFKALSLINMGNAKLAVLTFKEALRLTSEYALALEPHAQAELDKLHADRKITQIDFEILFHQQQQLAKKEGKGKDKSDNGEKQSDDPSGNQAGKGDRNKL